MSQMSRFLIICLFLRFSFMYATPVRLKCEDIDVPYSRQLCSFGKYVEDADPDSDFFEVHRRNSELSSALNFLYGPGSARYPGKRNNFPDAEQIPSLLDLIRNGSPSR